MALNLLQSLYHDHQVLLLTWLDSSYDELTAVLAMSKHQMLYKAIDDSHCR